MGYLRYESALIEAVLIKRYKRFLADIRLPSGEVLTVHCPNTGSMKNCAEPGMKVWLSTSDNPKRKYRHTWELARTTRGHYSGINTTRANRLVEGAIQSGTIRELRGYDELDTEVKYGRENSRIDILLGGMHQCYVEVKSVTLLESPIRSGRGFFPDALSERGRKHLRELSLMVRQGHRAVLLFCVQHSGILRVLPAAHIDPDYARALVAAISCGVEVFAYKCRMSPRGSRMYKSLPVELVDRQGDRIK